MKSEQSSRQSTNINSIEKLLNYLQLDKNAVEYSDIADSNFSFTASDSFIQRIKKGDPHDPLLLQIVPQKKELIKSSGFSDDPLDEKNALLAPGLLQKYQRRALLVVTPSCGIHCRYCFRRHSFRKEQAGSPQLSEQLEKNIQIIQSKKDITEVILSGGDPLTLSDQRFVKLLAKLAQIKHLRRLRIHSRQLVINPERLSKQLLNGLKQFPLPTIIVVHINHPAEINQQVKECFARLKLANIQLLNQSVLLKNINDQSEILISLSESLCQAGVMPYYLHMLDAVNGSSHFKVSDNKAKALINTMKEKLPGYLVPRLVRELSDDKYKRELY